MMSSVARFIKLLYYMILRKLFCIIFLLLCWSHPLFAADKLTTYRLQQFVTSLELASDRCDIDKVGTFFEPTAVIKLIEPFTRPVPTEHTFTLNEFKQSLKNGCQSSEKTDPDKKWTFNISASGLTALVEGTSNESVKVNNRSVPIRLYEESTIIIRNNRPMISNHIGRVEIQAAEHKKVLPDQDIIVNPNFVWLPIHL